MSQENVEIVKAALDAYNREFDDRAPGASRWAAKARTGDEILEAMSQENVELAWRASHAWNEGGAEALLPYLDAEVEWHPPRESMEPGTYRGHAGVRDYLGRLGDIFNAVRVEPVDVIDVDAERVISVIRLVARSEKFEREIDAEWAWLIQVRDGKGIKVWIFTDRAHALEAVGLAESE